MSLRFSTFFGFPLDSDEDFWSLLEMSGVTTVGQSQPSTITGTPLHPGRDPVCPVIHGVGDTLHARVWTVGPP